MRTPRFPSLNFPLNMADAVVKIDKELEKKIKELIKKDKFTYSNKKQVVNLALVEFLNTRIKNSGYYKKPGDFLSRKNLLKKKKEGREWRGKA